MSVSPFLFSNCSVLCLPSRGLPKHPRAITPGRASLQGLPKYPRAITQVVLLSGVSWPLSGPSTLMVAKIKGQKKWLRPWDRITEIGGYQKIPILCAGCSPHVMLFQTLPRPLVYFTPSSARRSEGSCYLLWELQAKAEEGS